MILTRVLLFLFVYSSYGQDVGLNYTELLPYLSPRGLQAIEEGAGWRDLNRTIFSKPYDKDKSPDGIINLGIAENFLTHEELKDYLVNNFTIDPLAQMTYGQGAAGSPRLRKALAPFFNTRFHAREPVAEDEIVVASGITSLIDSLAWCTCQENEGIIIPRPLYNNFPTDLKLRSSARLLPASFRWDDPMRGGNQTYSLDQTQSAVANVEALNRTFYEYAARGVKVRGVMITNPHNPLGYCYTKETLREIARFCAEHNLHFISDEIYSNSVYENKASPNATTFASVLSLDLSDVINRNLVHVMYGMSKDFGASGFRLGALHSRNKALIEAAGAVNLFSWPSYLAQDQWARVLENTTFVDSLLRLNSERLAATHDNLTAYLDQQHINYYQRSNAGLFVWARVLPYAKNATTPYIEVKARFKQILLKNGVFIQDGDAYYAEGNEKGWYRITFSYDLDMLGEGLKRLTKSLEELRKTVPGWEEPVGNATRHDNLKP